MGPIPGARRRLAEARMRGSRSRDVTQILRANVVGRRYQRQIQERRQAGAIGQEGRAWLRFTCCNSAPRDGNQKTTTIDNSGEAAA